MVVLLVFLNKKSVNSRKRTQSENNYIKKSQESNLEKSGNIFQLYLWQPWLYFMKLKSVVIIYILNVSVIHGIKKL